MTNREDKLAGVLLGTAVGDSLGLPREGLSARRAARTFGGSPLSHRFLFGRGMCSDDTEHSCMVAQALLAAEDDPDRFARSLAWRLRFWLLGLPAGIGLATLRSILKLWLGFSPARSGVYSAGNGPAMRAAVLGVCLGDTPDRLRAFVRASTRLTHTDPRAERGALLVALAAYHGANGVTGPAFLQVARANLPEPDTELETLLALLDDHLRRQAPPAELAAAMGLRRGVSGYVYHTVPIVLYCWLRWPTDFRRAVEEVILLGGDADTTGAILGGIAGATVGASGIPVSWLDGILEWPRSIGWIRRLAARLARQGPGMPLPLFWPGLVARNMLFMLVVLAHGFRRLLPPY